MLSVSDKILRYARARGPGSVFTPSDFIRLGSRPAVDQALSRLCKDKRLRRIAHGLYDYPRVHAQLGDLAPAPDAIVAKTADAIKDINPDYILPMHCTGFYTSALIEARMPHRIVEPSSGTRVVFGA